MRKQDGPTVADPLVKVDGALCGFGGEIRGCVIDPGNCGYRWGFNCNAHYSFSLLNLILPAAGAIPAHLPRLSGRVSIERKAKPTLTSAGWA
jgi:hypothetical protein